MATLRALECLIAVASTGSITDAARGLFLSQPAVSHQLGLLEREAGTPLFRREARGVRLTAAGRSALPEARRAVEAARSAISAARATGTADGGVLRLACGQSLIAVLAPVLHDWHREHPLLHITVRESTSREQLHSLLDADEVDLVLMPTPAPERFSATSVFDEEVVLVAAADHPLAASTTVTLSDLDGVALVHFAPENALSGWLVRAFTEAGVRPLPIMRTAVTSAAPLLAASGLGIAVCPVSAVGGMGAGVVRSFDPRWSRQIVAVTRHRADPLVERFIADIKDRTAADHEGRNPSPRR